MNTSETMLPELLADRAWSRRLASRLVQDDPEDVLQETWAAAVRRPGTHRGGARRWFAGVMRNLARFHRRSQARREAREREAGALVHGESGASRPDVLAEQLEAQRLLAGLVLDLPPIYRDVVLLRFYDDMSTDEIAARLSIPPGTARRRLTVSMARLRARLESGEQGKDWRRTLGVLVACAPGRPASGTTHAAMAGAAGITLVALLAVGTALGHEPVHPVRSQPELTSSPALRRLPAFSRAFASVESTKEKSAPPQAILQNSPAALVERYKVPLGTGPLRGPSEARVTVLEFVDYQCPFTSRAEKDLKRVLDAHAGDVRLQIVHRPLPFHPQADLLARAALAADAQGRFWQMHEHLIARPRGAWSPALLARHARDLGLDVARFEADLEGAIARDRLAIDEATANSLGIEGSPVFFVNGRLLVGADAPSRMRTIITEEIARAKELVTTGTRPADIYNALIATGKDGKVPETSTLPPPATGAGFDRLFTESGGCGPPLARPTALDFAFHRKDATGAIAISEWSVGGTGGRRYQVDWNSCRKEAWLRGVDATPEDFAAESQTVLAEAYRGKRVRFRAEIDGAPTGRWAGLWMRVEGDDGRVLSSARTPLVLGDRGWRPAEVVIAVSADAHAFSYGMVLAGGGTLGMRNLSVDVVAP